MRGSVEGFLAALPQGMVLGERTWQRRHRLLLLLLAAHLPALAAVGLATGRAVDHLGLELLPVSAALLMGSPLVRQGRIFRSCAVTLGLVLSSATLVHLTGGLIEAHFHYFVVLGFVALYEDWRSYLLAVGFVLLGHGVLGVLAPASMYNHPAAVARPWLWAGIHGAFVLAAVVGQVIFWKVSERELQHAQHYYRGLYEGERALVTHMRQAEELKTELIAIVSHEFRTPLTAILGYAKTMTARWDQLEPEQLRRCAFMVERQSLRLSRLVSGLLSASGDVVRAPGDRASVTKAVADVVEDLDQLPGVNEHPVAVDVPAGMTVAASADALQQILCNLLDNAAKFAAPETAVRLWARRHGDVVRLEIANLGEPISDQDLDRIFEPFVQRDSSDSRRHGGIGLGLYIVRKLVDALGGTVSVHNASPSVVFIVELPAGDAPRSKRVVEVEEPQPVGSRP